MIDLFFFFNFISRHLFSFNFYVKFSLNYFNCYFSNNFLNEFFLCNFISEHLISFDFSLSI